MKKLHTKLLTWYRAHGRIDLPWRNTTNAYEIYLSEIMLQQTQVKTVLDRFYLPFLQAFPTVEALANAPQNVVLKKWEGLGYYNRCKNLHNAANILAKDGGFNAMHNLPTDTLVDILTTLPGIGRNTAHAVAAFAFNRPVPVMEANLKRVLARFYAIKNPTDKQWWDKAHELLDTENPFDYNQAMMDIGATICKKTKPKCDDCPLNNKCKGRISPELYPTAKEKKVIPVRRKIIICFKNEQGEYYITPRESRFLHGLYGFAEYDPAEVYAFEGKTYTISNTTKIGHITQTYSHFRLDAGVFCIQTNNKHPKYMNLMNITALPLSKADQKVLALL